MPLKTNLNVNPYYDDFDKKDNFYRVLFKPGYPVQARELTGLQSVLQNQIESFGSHIFKEGSMVIPGGITCDNQFTTIKVNPTHLGIDITVYLDALISANDKKGIRVRGEQTSVVGVIKGYSLPSQVEDVNEITLFVKYREGAADGETVQFSNEEVLILDENVTYGNTSLNAGDTILTLVSVDAARTGYAVGVASGVYFVRGCFIDVPESLIVLDHYDNNPSYRVGFDILEEIITSDQDNELNDNAKGFTNYAAPGSDRLKISVKLVKKQLLDFNDINFIELVKINNGEIKKLQNKSEYSVIKDYFAKRTFEESGNYSIDKFRVEVVDSLNNETGGGGLFLETQKTDEGNTPNEDLMCYKISAGTAYVKGYDINLVGTTIIDVPKPRKTKTISDSRIPFGMGSRLKVNNVTGVPIINIGASVSGTTNTNIIELYNRRRNTSTTTAGTGLKIGEARVYWYGVTDASYSGARTEWDLYLFDVQTYTDLYLANQYSTAEVPISSYVRGLSSGATGYLALKRNASCYSLSQTSGTFLIGEQVIINENHELQVAIRAINEYSTQDIKSVYQDSTSLNSTIQRDFIADSVLYEVSPPDFNVTDKLTITGGNTGTVPGRFFNGITGIKTESIIKYQTAGQIDPNFNIISNISGVGTNITLSAVASPVADVCTNTVNNGDSVFSIMIPKITDSLLSGLFAELPARNVSTVDLSRCELTITKQITGKSTNAQGTLTLTTADLIDATAGITSVFFETFDAERYSIHYSDGTTDQLTSDKFAYGADGSSVTFSGLQLSQSNVTIIATANKTDVTSKTKDFIKSQQVSIVRTSGISTATGLSTSRVYGLRVEDDQICLNVPDVVNIRAVYESTDTSTPVLDKLTFATGLALNSNAIIGEKIVGKDSRAVAQIVNTAASSVDFVYLNQNNFRVGENVMFKESGLDIAVQLMTPGSYVDRTVDYHLDSGNNIQYCDYSRIKRKDGSGIPSKKLLVIFDYYKVSAGNSGDIFTVNSYGQDRYRNDIPKLINGKRITDYLDFRPRVTEFDSNSATTSPFAFSSRSYETNYRYVLTPDETSRIGYSYYLPRVDMVTINRLGQVEVIQGESSDNPRPPLMSDDAMEIARIALPAYLFNPITTPRITLKDNRRFTMRDISALENRIETLEELTSLSLLETSATTMDVVDANGNNRFKSGFVVSAFEDKSLFDPRFSLLDVNKEEKCGISPVDFWTINAEIAFDPSIDITKADITQNLKCLDPNIQKTGDILTLAYDEVDWIDQPHATNVENVNPFNVIVFVGAVVLDPASDNWTRTIYIDDNRTESSGAEWTQEATKNVNVVETTDYVKTQKRGRGETFTTAQVTTTTTETTTYEPKLGGPSREFNYIENVKVSGTVDPFMRAREVYFAANGLRPFTKHYHYLDSQQVDIVPKLCEITMISGSFTVFEDADVFDNGHKIAHIRIQKPNHKFGDTSRPDIGAGLGSPSVLVEEYSVDPYDKSRPAPGSDYSATSKLINFGVRTLATEERYYGYVVQGAKVVGRTSGATATITKAELISDNWGDIIACFCFRDPNSNPAPPVKVTSGTKTVQITAVPPGVTPLPGSTVNASEALGTYSGSGTTLTQETSRVSVRNPPRPANKPTEVNVTVKAPHRDPLAQSFTVDGTGAFLTSFDLYFGRKDPTSKIFVELRTVELGTPTNLLVQDFTQVSLNPANINISDDASIPTRIRFSSPVYLESGREYAIVILSPGSDEYEMWTATMGGKTVRTQNVPDVQSVVVSKQYIGGSLFKSQNGTIWTASQYQDLTFKLYKAKFVPSGTATFYNTPVTPKGSNSAILVNNPIEGLPRKLKVSITGSDVNIKPGIKIGQRLSSDALSVPSVTGFVENLGGPISGSNIVSAGIGYSNGTFASVPLYSISGKGESAVASVVISGNVVTGVTVTSAGSGYVVGELLGITTSSSGGRGSGALVNVSAIGTADSMYLTNVQGEVFTNSATVVYYTNPNSEATRTNSGATISGNSALIDSRFTGNVFRIKQYNHAHHGGNNKIEIVDVSPDREKVDLTGNVGLNDTVVSVANTTVFAKFEGQIVDAGYALISDEVISYSGITQTSGNAGTLSITGRGLNGTIQSEHTVTAVGAPTVEFIQPYEVNGVSLMRINTTHDIPASSYRTENSNVDNYHLEFNRLATSGYIARSTGVNMLNFESQKAFGGNTIGISQNYQFSTIVPQFNVITPGKGTTINAQLRTISGTSAGGRETSFIDTGYDAIPLNKVHYFDAPRMVASEVNEQIRLTTLPKNKSLTLRIDLKSTDVNLSPVLDIQNATFTLGRNKINNPVSDYVMDSRTNTLDHDPHSTVFVTQMVSLQQPATSLKVIIAANRQQQADFRVFYRLLRPDSAEISQTYLPFPGFDNLIDTDGDGFGDQIIDISKNSGRADSRVLPDNSRTYSEYQFSINNLEQFQGFSIKVVSSSTNESTPIKFKDFRAIALA